MADDKPMPGQWIDRGPTREIYDSRYVTLTVNEVQRPDGEVVNYEVVRGPQAAGMVVCHPERGFLMIWRHRFMPDTWGWEIPGGLVDPGEASEAAARRECLEETGWEVTGTVQHLSRHHPAVGLVAQTFDLYVTEDAVHRGDPADVNEAATVAWRSREEVLADLAAGLVSDAFSQLAVALTLAGVRAGGVSDSAP